MLKTREEEHLGCKDCIWYDLQNADGFFCILEDMWQQKTVTCPPFTVLWNLFSLSLHWKKKINDQIKCFHFATHGTIHVNQNKNLPFIVWEKNLNYLKLLLFSLFRCQAEKSCSKSKLFWILSQTAFISLCLMSLSKLWCWK